MQGTRLRRRLFEERRLLDFEKGLYDKEGLFVTDSRGTTNIIPKGMTRPELFSGYLSLVEKVYDWDNFAARIKGFVSNVKRRPNVPQESGQQKSLSPALNAFLLSLEEKVRNAVFDIFLYTRQHSPFMIGNVAGLMARQYLEASKLPLLREAILKQMKFEESLDIEKFIERTEVLTSGNSDVL
jgi:hypothetical protein